MGYERAVVVHNDEASRLALGYADQPVALGLVFTGGW